MAIVTDRRRIVVISGEQRADVAVPVTSNLGQALGGLGIVLTPGRHIVLDHAGRQARLDLVAAELADGALFSVIDLNQKAHEGRQSASDVEGVQARGGLWWMLGAAGVIVSVVALLYAGTGGLLAGGVERFIASAILAFGAVASSVVWALRAPRDAVAEALTMLAPLALAFAAGMVAVDRELAQSTQLAVVSGLLFSGVLAMLLSAAVPSARLRGSVGTAAIVILMLALISGLTLLAGWGIVAAATLSAGIVPLGLRFLPSTLVNLPEGHHIDYKHFMSARWSVRGDIPHSPETVDLDTVREVVGESSARLVTGIVLLSGVAAVFLPLALADGIGENPFVTGGFIGLTCSLTIALLLSARHYTSQVLRWMPRAAALIVALVATISASVAFGDLALVAAASALFLIGLGSAMTLVPIARGARSLGWSRLADVFEWLAIVLSFPSALLAADALTLLRGMMAS